MLDPILVDAAVAAGAEARFGVAVADVERDRAGTVTGVVGRHHDGREFRAEARIVVGADGVRSTIAQRVEASFDRVGSGVGSTTYGYWPGLDVDGYQWNFRPDAASGVIPTNGGLVCVFASATPQRIGRGGAATICRDRGRRRPRPRRQPRRGGTAADTDVHRRARLRPPVLGTGVGPGRRRRVLQGPAERPRDHRRAARRRTARPGDRRGRRDGADERDALAGYQATRDALSRELFDVIDVICGHRWTDDEIGDLLLRLSAAMSDEVDVLAGLPPADQVAAPTAGVAHLR